MPVRKRTFSQVRNKFWISVKLYYSDMYAIKRNEKSFNAFPWACLVVANFPVVIQEYLHNH